MTIDRLIDTSIFLDAPPSEVWRALTDPVLMAQWMAEPEMQLDIATDWQVGGPIVVTGRHHVRFENRGTVLRFEPYSALAYTHLSSVSRLSDVPRNRTTIEFGLTPLDSRATSLHLRISGFPTESIYRHFDFYWRVTLPLLQHFTVRLFSRGSA